MRNQRRTTFAAPFVMVVGCGTPAAPPAEPVLPTTPVVAVAADAALPDAPACAFGPLACSNCEPDISSGSLIASVSSVTSLAGDLILEIPRVPGFDVDSTSTAEFIDANGVAIADSTFFIDRVTDTTIRAQLYKHCTLPSTRVRISKSHARTCHEKVACKGCKVEMFPGGSAAVGRVIAIDGKDGDVRVEVEMPRKFTVLPSHTAFFVDENLEPLPAPPINIVGDSKGRMSVSGALSCELPSKLVYVWYQPSPLPVSGKCVPGPGHTCNPPRPRPLPTSIEAKIITAQVQGPDLLVVLNAGQEHRVTEQSHVEVPPNRECKIIHVTKTWTSCKVQMSPDETRTVTTVRITSLQVPEWD